MALGCGGARPSHGAPVDPLNGPLVVSPAVVDLGLVSRGSEREGRFGLGNAGRDPVTVGQVETSCGCLTVELPMQTLPPGQTAEVRVRLDMGKEPGFVGGLRIDVCGWTPAGAKAFAAVVEAMVQ
jgi:hypothetical protein